MEIKMTDLYEECPSCKGVGEVKISQEKMSSFGYQPLSGMETCTECGGAKGFITESGQTILQFLQITKLAPFNRLRQ